MNKQIAVVAPPMPAVRDQQQLRSDATVPTQSIVGTLDSIAGQLAEAATAGDADDVSVEIRATTFPGGQSQVSFSFRSYRRVKT